MYPDGHRHLRYTGRDTESYQMGTDRRKEREVRQTEDGIWPSQEKEGPDHVPSNLGTER